MKQLLRRRWQYLRTVGVLGCVVGLMLGVTTAASHAGDTPTQLSPSTTPLASAAQFNGQVSALLAVGDQVFVGGSFTSALNASGHWVTREGLAAIDATTGALDDVWQASVIGTVSALASDGTQVFVGGAFSGLSGERRKNLGAVSLATGAATTWAPPSPDKAVLALAVSGSRVYAGGLFQSVGGANRGRLAAFDTATGQVDRHWTPAASGKVLTLAPSADGGQVYVGGGFSAMNGNSAFGYEAGVDAATGNNTGWPSDHVYYPIMAIAVSPDGVFAGGDGPGGHLLAWGFDGSFRTDPLQTDGAVQAVAVTPGQVFAGGHFTNVCLGNTGGGTPYVCTNPLSRRKLFGLDLATSTYTSWNPVANSAHGVLAVAVVPDTGMLVVGGAFTTINKQSRQHLAVFPSAA